MMTPEFVLNHLKDRPWRVGIVGEMNFQQGRKDRLEGKPCLSTNGAYLEGWYDLENDCYYMTRQEIVDPENKHHCPTCGKSHCT